jgi:hypothetical protein
MFREIEVVKDEEEERTREERQRKKGRKSSYSPSSLHGLGILSSHCISP